MTEDLDFNKEFKFVLQQDDVVLYERLFNANVISPITRNNVDIRKDIYGIIKSIQQLLSKENYNTTYNFKDKTTKEGELYKLFEYHKNEMNKYPKDIRDALKYTPKVHSKSFDEKILTGVSCRFALYINENLIVERIFFVENFNRICRWSVDLVLGMNETTNTIYNKIIEKDIGNIWDVYDIINRTGMTISQIRELSQKERIGWLYKIR